MAAKDINTTGGWSTEQILFLIEVLKPRESFWNPKHEEYMKRNLRRESVHQMCVEMEAVRPNTRGAEIVAKFKSLKAQLSRELRVRKRRSGDAKKTRRELWCFEELKFMKDTIETRIGVSNIPPASVHAQNALLEAVADLEDLDVDEDLDSDAFFEGGQTYECELSDDDELLLMTQAEDTSPNASSATVGKEAAEKLLVSTAANSDAARNSETPGPSTVQKPAMKQAYNFTQKSPTTDNNSGPPASSANKENRSPKDTSGRWVAKKKKADQGDKLIRIVEKTAGKVESLLTPKPSTSLGAIVDETMRELSPNKAKRFKKQILLVVADAEDI